MLKHLQTWSRRKHTCMVLTTSALGTNVKTLFLGNLQCSCAANGLPLRAPDQRRSVRELAQFIKGAGHQVSDSEPPMKVLNVSISVGLATPSSYAILREPSVETPLDQSIVPANARNHAREVNAAIMNVSTCPLPHTRGWVRTVCARTMWPLACGHGSEQLARPCFQPID